MRKSRARHAIALALTMAGGVVTPVAADTVQARPAVLEFDEIDHVYTTEALPPPGSFRQHAGLVAPAVAEPAHRRPNVLDALGSASTAVGNVSTVVGASGELGRALRVADVVARLAPLTTAMGMAGGRRFDALLQTYVLPRVSPTGAVMLQGFLSAQSEYKAHFVKPRTEAPPAPSAAPAELAPYANGALRHYTVGSNGWVRIDDPSTNVSVVIKPDAGTSYIIDNAAKTVRAVSYAGASSAPTSVGATASDGATAAVNDRVDALGQTTLDGVAATGFRTQSSVHVAGTGACSDTTITSTRVEYFAPSRVSRAANVSPAAQRPDATGCDPSTTVKHAGVNIPTDQLLLYQANTVEKKTANSTDRYTVVIERGNVRERNAYDTEPFDIPAGFRQLSVMTP